MYLETLRPTLRQELCGAHTQRHFEAVKPDRQVIQSYATVRALLASLEARAPEAQPARQALVRALVVAAQDAPAERLWKQLLIYTFMPGLEPIRMRTSSRAHPPEDLDGELWAVFLDVVASYPLHRAGSIAAGILYDTRKRYHRRLRRQQREVERIGELVQATRGLSSEQRRAWCFQRFSPAALSAEDRAEMLAALVRCDTISAADARLLWCTDVCGMTIPQFLEQQIFQNKTGVLPQRACDRAWRRRLRARQRLEVFFKKMTVAVSSFGPYPASYIVRGKNANDTTMTDPDTTLVAVVLRDLAQRLTRRLLVLAPDHQLVLALALVIEEVAEAYLGVLDEGERAGMELSAPPPAMARVLARLDRYIAESSARWQQAS